MRIATWLLARFGVEDALVGDLVEQRNAGRPRAWLWRTLVGVACGLRQPPESDKPQPG